VTNLWNRIDIWYTSLIITLLHGFHAVLTSHFQLFDADFLVE